MSESAAPPPGFVAPGIRRGRYLFLPPARRGSLHLVSAGWEECSPRFLIDRPSFRFHAVELLAAGQWEVRTDGRWKPAAAGTLVAYGPGHRGGIRACGTGPHLKYFADFAGRDASNALAGALRSRDRQRVLAHPAPIIELYEQLLSGESLPTPHRGQWADLLLKAMLVRLGAEASDSRHRASPTREVFERCRRHLEENYTRVRTIGAAARACHVAPEYFSRLFRRYAGETAAGFLARLRVNHAAKLLQRSPLSVKAAGQAVGFEDPYHFSRVFKRIHGVSPRTFSQRNA